MEGIVEGVKGGAIDFLHRARKTEDFLLVCVCRVQNYIYTLVNQINVVCFRINIIRIISSTQDQRRRRREDS